MHMTVTVEGAARLFLHQVWRLYGLPKCVISDRGSQFVAHFTRELYHLLGIKLASFTAWHPQTDRQTEHVNQELDQYLQLFVNEQQDDWYDLLPMVEFQHNNHVHSATQQPLFLLDTGRLPRMGFEPRQNPSGLETVNEFTERMRTAIDEAKSTICKAQNDIKRYYDCQVRNGTGRSGPELSGVTPEWKGFGNKMGEQPWPQLVRCASICYRVCGCVFQED